MKLISNIPATKLLQAKLDPTDKVIFFALAWSPTPDDKSLIAIDQKGTVYLIDYNKRKIITQVDKGQGKFALNSVSWNTHDPNLFLVSSMDCNCYLFSISAD